VQLPDLEVRAGVRMLELEHVLKRHERRVPLAEHRLRHAAVEQNGGHVRHHHHRGAVAAQRLDVAAGEEQALTGVVRQPPVGRFELARSEELFGGVAVLAALTSDIARAAVRIGTHGSDPGRAPRLGRGLGLLQGRHAGRTVTLLREVLVPAGLAEALDDRVGRLLAEHRGVDDARWPHASFNSYYTIVTGRPESRDFTNSAARVALVEQLAAGRAKRIRDRHIDVLVPVTRRRDVLSPPLEHHVNLERSAVAMALVRLLDLDLAADDPVVHVLEASDPAWIEASTESLCGMSWNVISVGIAIGLLLWKVRITSRAPTRVRAALPLRHGRRFGRAAAANWPPCHVFPGRGSRSTDERRARIHWDAFRRARVATRTTEDAAVCQRLWCRGAT